MTTVLSPDQIKLLLKADDGPISNQVGPIRFFDKEMRCASRGCSSPTYIKFQGVPNCMMHVIRKANEMLVEKGITQ